MDMSASPDRRTRMRRWAGSTFHLKQLQGDDSISAMHLRATRPILQAVLATQRKSNTWIFILKAGDKQGWSEALNRLRDASGYLLGAGRPPPSYLGHTMEFFVGGYHQPSPHRLLARQEKESFFSDQVNISPRNRATRLCMHERPITRSNMKWMWPGNTCWWLPIQAGSGYSKHPHYSHQRFHRFSACTSPSELRNAKSPATMITVTYCGSNHGHLVVTAGKMHQFNNNKETSGHFHSCADMVSFETLLSNLDLFSISSHTVTVIFGSTNPLFWILLAWLTDV